MLPPRVTPLLHVLLAATSFWAVTLLIRPWIPMPRAYGLQAKFDYFSRHKDDFDAVFLGTSRVFRGLDNTLIDEELAEAGIPMRSFNFAVAGMLAFEQDWLLHEILELEPARLKWVFLEGGPWDPRFRHEELTYSSRSVFWHTPLQTWKALVATMRLEAPLPERLRLVGTHLNLLLWHLTNYGQGTNLAERVFRSPRARAMWERNMDFLEEDRGYQSPEEHTDRAFADDVLELMEDPEPFEERVAGIKRENRAPQSLDSIHWEAVREQHRVAEEHGVELLYFIPPGYEGSPQRPFLHEQGHIETLFDFNRPEDYPELFRLDRRYDAKHLNRRGAVAFSRLLARAIIGHVRGEPRH